MLGRIAEIRRCIERNVNSYDENLRTGKCGVKCWNYCKWKIKIIWIWIIIEIKKHWNNNRIIQQHDHWIKIKDCLITRRVGACSRKPWKASKIAKSKRTLRKCDIWSSRSYAAVWKIKNWALKC